MANPFDWNRFAQTTLGPAITSLGNPAIGAQQQQGAFANIKMQEQEAKEEAEEQEIVRVMREAMAGGQDARKALQQALATNPELFMNSNFQKAADTIMEMTKPQEVKAPQFMPLTTGDQTVTYMWDPNTASLQEVATAPRWKPEGPDEEPEFVQRAKWRVRVNLSPNMEEAIKAELANRTVATVPDKAGNQIPVVIDRDNLTIQMPQIIPGGGWEYGPPQQVTPEQLAELEAQLSGEMPLTQAMGDPAPTVSGSVPRAGMPSPEATVTGVVTGEALPDEGPMRLGEATAIGTGAVRGAVRTAGAALAALGIEGVQDPVLLEAAAVIKGIEADASRYTRDLVGSARLAGIAEMKDVKQLFPTTSGFLGGKSREENIEDLIRLHDRLTGVHRTVNKKWEDKRLLSTEEMKAMRDLERTSDEILTQLGSRDELVAAKEFISRNPDSWKRFGEFMKQGMGAARQAYQRATEGGPTTPEEAPLSTAGPGLNTEAFRALLARVLEDPDDISSIDQKAILEELSDVQVEQLTDALARLRGE